LSIKTILVSQPKPEGEKSPYYDLAEKYKLKIDFRPFIHVEGVAVQEFRQQKVNIPEYTAIILTSKTAVDHFFRIAEEIRFEVPDTMKSFVFPKPWRSTFKNTLRTVNERSFSASRPLKT
jgi:uroporphyrinogen-III synthase